MKERTAWAHGTMFDVGDAYTYTAVDRETKLLACFHVGKRSSDDTNHFAEKLAACFAAGHRPQISTDGFSPYRVAIPAAFGHAVDHGVVVKQFGPNGAVDNRRYSPASIVGFKLVQNAGRPNADRICTSHVERHNLTIRMQNRRFTRLTNAFSKKWENHWAAVAVWFAFYNFCRVHQTLRITPAMAAGITDHIWSIRQLLEAA